MSLRDLLQRLRALLLGAPPAPPPAALLLGDPARLSIPHLLHHPFPSTVLTAPPDLPPATLHLVLPPPDRTLLDAATLTAHLPPPAALIAAASSREDLLDILHALPTPLLLSPDLPNLHAVLHALTHREPLSPALLLPGATPTTHTLTRSAQRDDLTAHVRDLALAHGAHRRVAEAAASAADELIINALYNAPTGPDGAPLHRSTPRTIPIDLPPHHASTFTLTHAAPWLALTARDPFGSLPPPHPPRSPPPRPPRRRRPDRTEVRRRRPRLLPPPPQRPRPPHPPRPRTTHRGHRPPRPGALLQALRPARTLRGPPAPQPLKPTLHGRYHGEPQEEFSP